MFEVWLTLISVKYYDNPLVLILLNQALTTPRATGPGTFMRCCLFFNFTQFGGGGGGGGGVGGAGKDVMSCFAKRRGACLALV